MSQNDVRPATELLELTRRAWEAGFRAGSCSDHFHPWSVRGQSGFAWSWLGAALEAVPISFGTVCAPGPRYHPASIAQAAATLTDMYPGRFWLAVGTGQNLNEHITGDEWPPKAARRKRLRAAVDMMRALWAGETVTTRGPFRVQDAKLYTRGADLAALGTGYLLASMGIPCLYYGTEQGFDGAGDDDDYVRETMFGGAWGPFGGALGHHFNAQHPAYQQIARVARVREMEAALRYGRQFFRQVSGDGLIFGPSRDPGGIFAFSRVLDDDSLLVAINVDDEERSAYVAVDRKLTPPGTQLRNLLSDCEVEDVAESQDTACMRVTLPPRSMSIWKRA